MTSFTAANRRMRRLTGIGIVVAAAWSIFAVIVLLLASLELPLL